MSDTMALALFVLAALACVIYTVLLTRLDGWDDPRRRPPASHPRDLFEPRA